MGPQKVDILKAELTCMLADVIDIDAASMTPMKETPKSSSSGPDNQAWE